LLNEFNVVSQFFEQSHPIKHFDPHEEASEGAKRINHLNCLVTRLFFQDAVSTHHREQGVECD
jgi:hypothetical protein